MMRICAMLGRDYDMPKQLRDDHFFDQTRLKQIVDSI